MRPSKIKQDFLKDDLYNALKELFVGTVTWTYGQKHDTCYLRDLGMFTCFVQARAIYEFFYGRERGDAAGKKKKGEYRPGGTARARHFAPSWKPRDTDKLYSKYMGDNTPAQKRVFHLVYGRGDFSGGVKGDESDHLKNQVLVFAKDLKRLTEEFTAACVEQEHRELAECALARALEDGHNLSEGYGIKDSL